MTLLRKPVYYDDGTFAGRVVDLVFDSTGKVVALVLARTLSLPFPLPFTFRLVPYKYVQRIFDKLYLTLPRELLELLEPQELGSEVFIVVAGPLRKRALMAAAIVTPWAVLYVVLQLAAEPLRTLLAVAVLLMAFLVPAIVETVVVHDYPRGLFRLKAVQHSYVRDSEGHLIGVVKKVVLDEEEGVIKEIVVGPSITRMTVLEDVYVSRGEIRIPPEVLDVYAKGSLYLSVTYSQLKRLVGFKASNPSALGEGKPRGLLRRRKEIMATTTP